jgi:NTE family protein
MAEIQTSTGTVKLALVIGSGSVKSAAGVGVVRALQRAGISVDLYVGCSGGSLYAALLALGHSPDELLEMSARLWTRDLTSQPRRLAWLQVLLPKLFKFDERFSLVDDRRIMRALHAVYGTRTFGDTKTPLLLTATDFHNGEQVTLSQGLLVDALRASIAIPYIFSAYPVDGRLLMDGYMSDPMPVGVAVKEGAAVIVAVGFDSPYQSQVNGLMRYVFQLSSITSNNLLKTNFAFHSMAHHGEVITIMPEFKQRIHLFDTEKLPYVIEQGERSAEAQIPYLRQLLDQAKHEGK